MVKHHEFTEDFIRERIFNVRGEHVMLDRDFAALYGVQTKALNQAVKRNLSRFPDWFSFSLNAQEKLELVTTCDRLRSMKHSSVLPRAFTEQGVAMLSAVLHSPAAIQLSIEIIQAFVALRRLMVSQANVMDRLGQIERRHLLFEDETKRRFNAVFRALESQVEPRGQGIFFDGEVYDAYVFVTMLIRRAESSLILVDNYVDQSVLTMLSKRKSGVSAVIYTKGMDRQLLLDLKKHNDQYSPIEVREFGASHDRFLLIDQCEMYHFGASFKDLGKRWVAFSRMDSFASTLIHRLGHAKTR